MRSAHTRTHTAPAGHAQHSRAPTHVVRCRPVARVKLGLVRGGFVGVVVPLAAAVAVAAAAVAVLMIVLPVILFGPCALVYEPVRRGRRLEANPPSRLAGSGGMLVRACLRSAHEG